MNKTLKRKESPSDLTPSPRKKTHVEVKFIPEPSDPELRIFCTKMTPSGKFYWRAKGVESYYLTNQFVKFRATGGREGIDYTKNLDRRVLEGI